MIPAPVVEKHSSGVWLVRDDHISGGTKRCFADKLIKGHEEVVYASPVYGGAQIAIAHAARENGARATIFCAKRGTPHPRTIEANKAGAKIVQVPHGYLSNIKAKAKAYCAKTGAYMLPFGLDCDLANQAIADRARLAQAQIPDRINQVWCVGGSGVLCRGLQSGLRADSFHVVQIGRQLKPEDVQDAKVYVSKQDFADDAKHPPPFPSCSNYDAKAWTFITEHKQGTALFWNVMQ